MPAKLFAPRTAARPARQNSAALGTESFEPYRGELFAHCYRMLGSPHDAEDVMQEMMARAWTARPSFAERSSLRTWLYRIATNLCLDELRRARRRRRELPVGAGTAIAGNDPTPPSSEPARWVGPFPDRILTDGAGRADPEASYLSVESIRLAFIVALQRLSPSQRAVLILRDVMGWSAREVADMMRMSVAAVNSSLHRARVVVGKKEERAPRLALADLSSPDHELLERYVRAWVTGDAESLAALLSTGATFSMPPNPAWLRGRREVHRYLARVVLAKQGVTRRLVATRANGTIAFGVYTRPAGARGKHRAHSLQVVTLARGRVTDIVSFHDAAVFPLFGLALTSN